MLYICHFEEANATEKSKKLGVVSKLSRFLSRILGIEMTEGDVETKRGE